MNGKATPTTQNNAPKPGFGLLDYPLIDPAEAASFYHSKISFETDPADVWEALQAGEKGFVVIDTRAREFYADGHVPGAISLPWREMNEATTASIPREKLIVTYCNGIGCNGSTRGAARMTALGFRVKEMMGGFDWWKRNGQPVEVVKNTPACPVPTTAEAQPESCGC
jgi:rhodanese-related sulfurtransferase